jgi:hypothetical protein
VTTRVSQVVLTGVEVPIYIPVTILTRILLTIPQIETPVAESSTEGPSLPGILAGVSVSTFILILIVAVVYRVLKLRRELSPQDIEDIEDIEEASSDEGNQRRGNGGNRNPLEGIGFEARPDDIVNMLFEVHEGNRQGTDGVENPDLEDSP